MQGGNRRVLPPERFSRRGNVTNPSNKKGGQFMYGSWLHELFVINLLEKEDRKRK
jgi:hypothetical protein